jgi:HlyD family secretion protein
MTRGTKIGIFVGLPLLAVAGLTFFAISRRRHAGTEVRMEAVARRDLVSVVTASGEIEAKTSVDVSADITGRIVEIAVREGDLVRRGQFLLQIDPGPYKAAVARAEGVVASTRATVLQTKANRDQAERDWQRAKQLSEAGQDLIAPQQVEAAQTAYQVAEANYQAADAQLAQARASLQEAEDNLGKTRLIAPMAGRVVRVAVEEGEVAVPGTFSRETGLLMTIADLSVMLAKVQVDETDIVRLRRGDSVEVTIDAYPDSAFAGRVTRISHSATSATAQNRAASADRAVDFDVEITLARPPKDIRPDLSCTARIVTDTRQRVLAVPIIALTTREAGRERERVVRDTAAESSPVKSTARRPAEREGVFVVRDGIARFQPVTVGIAGEEHFEVLAGLREGETIVAGSYQAIRDLTDSTRVRATDSTTKARPAS